MANPNQRMLGDFRFLFDGNDILFSIKRKKSAIACFVSTMHKVLGISASVIMAFQHLVIEHYSETSEGFDQTFSTTSCSRKTRRWTLCTFYSNNMSMITMINMVSVNNWVVQKAIFETNEVLEQRRCSCGCKTKK